MKISTIIEELLRAGRGAVLPERYKRFSRTRIRLHMLVSRLNEDEKRELRRNFPSLEKHGMLFKLGEFPSLSSANEFLARKRNKSRYPVIRRLFLLPLKEVVKPKQKTTRIVQNSRGKVVIF